MKRELPNLNALRAFEAVATHLNFSRAADELGVTQSAVSHQIKILEDYLAIPLLLRTKPGVTLTSAGKEYLQSTALAFDAIEAAGRKITASAPSVITVSVLPTFAMKWLIPRLPHFELRCPGIEVRMVTSIQPVNFDRDGIDIAIRVGSTPGEPAQQKRPRIDLEMTGNWNNLLIERLMPDVLVPLCAPSRLEALPVREVADIFQFTLLHNATRSRAWPDWFEAQGVEYRPRAETSFGHFFMSIQAAIDGRGVALVPRMFVEDDIAAGRLAVVYDKPVESAGAYYVLTRREQADVDRISQFRAWIKEETS